MTLFAIIPLALFAWTSWRDERLGILVLLTLLPTYLVRFSFAGIPFTFLELLILVATLRFLVSLKQRPLHVSQTTKQFFLPVGLLLLSATLSTLVAPDLRAALGILKAYFVEPALVLFLLTQRLDASDRTSIFTALSIPAVFLSLFGIYQYLTGTLIPAPYDTALRITSLFSYPNALGLFLAPILAAAPFLFLESGRKDVFHKRRLWRTVILLLVPTLVLSRTQGAWGAVPVAIAAMGMLLWQPKRRFHTMIVGSLVGVFVILGGLLFTPHLLASPSLQVRMSQWQETWTYLKDGHFLLGAGLSGYPTAIAPYHNDLQYEIFQYPHNLLLNISVELGLLGVVAVAWLGFEVARTIFRHRKDLLVLAAGSALLEMTIHGLVDVPYFKNDLAVFTLTLIAVLILTETKARSFHNIR